MKVVIQRVTKAKVSIDSKKVSKIGLGLLILLGIGQDDTQQDVTQMAQKISKLRIMSDENKKMNRSIIDVKGEILVVSQFTLLANTQKGNRPSFINAADPQKAKKLYRTFVDQLANLGIPVKTGEFGAYMHISLINDGPVTIVLEA